METVFTIIILLFSAIVTIIIVAIVAGITALVGPKSNAGGRFKKVFKYGLWSLIISPLMFLYGGLVERNTYVVNEVELESNDISQDVDGYKIVQISDLHLFSFKHRKDYLQRMVNKINSIEADVILFTGDIVTYGPEEIDGLENILAGLKAKEGVYSILGNHDYCIYDRFISEEERIENVREIIERERNMGWNVMLNTNVNIGRDSSICLVGVENISSSVHFPSYGSLNKAIEGAKGDYTILMSHDPSYWEAAIKSHPEIDLTLSGHTHAMQLSLFGYSPSRLLYKYFRGLYSKDGHHLYVNIGLGETAIMSRIGAYPEITVLSLCKTKATSPEVI